MTNETLRGLLEMIGGVEITGGVVPWQLKPLSTTEWGRVDRECGAIPQQFAQALIEKAAVEWLSTGGRWHIIYSPVVRGGAWRITAVTNVGYHCTVSGPTLPEALHAAVEAVKESEDANSN